MRRTELPPFLSVSFPFLWEKGFLVSSKRAPSPAPLRPWPIYSLRLLTSHLFSAKILNFPRAHSSSLLFYPKVNPPPLFFWDTHSLPFLASSHCQQHGELSYPLESGRNRIREFGGRQMSRRAARNNNPLFIHLEATEPRSNCDRKTEEALLSLLFITLVLARI